MTTKAQLAKLEAAKLEAAKLEAEAEAEAAMEAAKAEARTILGFPAELKFSVGRGESKQVHVAPYADIGDARFFMLAQYGTRLFNDTRNGAMKEAWGELPLEKAFPLFIDWMVNKPSRAVGERALASPTIEAVREYIGTKMQIPAFKNAVEKAFPDSKKRPRPASLEALREFLAKLAPVTDERWAEISKGIEENAKAIEARRAEMAEMVDEDAAIADLF